MSLPSSSSIITSTEPDTTRNSDSGGSPALMSKVRDGTTRRRACSMKRCTPGEGAVEARAGSARGATVRGGGVIASGSWWS